MWTLLKGRWLEGLALLAYAGGVAFRWWYVLVAHHPRHHVTSDAIPITDLAWTFLDPERAQQIDDTTWPPGMAAFVATHLARDPTLGTAADVQLVLSCTVPLLLGHAALVGFGRKAAAWTVVLASGHLGFAHYAGFFLSEQLFQFSVVAAVWMTALALVASTRPTRVVGGLAAGLAWGLATAFRPNALPVAGFALLVLATFWWRTGRSERGITVAAALVGLVLAMAPLGHRCTTLSDGAFCPGSNNLAINVAMGHAGEVKGVRFEAPPGSERPGSHSWYPPALIHHGYQGTAKVPASMFDTWGVLAWVGERFIESPLQFVLASLGNAADLFGLDYWPDDYGHLYQRSATVWKQLVFVVILIPGLFGCLLCVRRVARRRPVSDLRVFAASGVLGMLLTAAATLGEARYRIPFDSFLVLLAADLFANGARERDASGPVGDAAMGHDSTRASPSEPAQLTPSPGSYNPAAIALGVIACSAGLGVIVAVAHPSFSLGESITTREIEPRRERTVSAASLRKPRKRASPWDAKGNVVFRCSPDCPEVRIRFDGRLVRARTLQASVDHNDRYRVFFYSSGERIARADVPLRESKPGLRIVEVPVPPPALEAGFDEIGVMPLYGDGRYALGHLRLRSVARSRVRQPPS